MNDETKKILESIVKDIEEMEHKSEKNKSFGEHLGYYTAGLDNAKSAVNKWLKGDTATLTVNIEAPQTPKMIEKETIELHK